MMQNHVIAEIIVKQKKQELGRNLNQEDILQLLEHLSKNLQDEVIKILI